MKFTIDAVEPEVVIPKDCDELFIMRIEHISLEQLQIISESNVIRLATSGMPEGLSKIFWKYIPSKLRKLEISYSSIYNDGLYNMLRQGRIKHLSLEGVTLLGESNLDPFAREVLWPRLSSISLNPCNTKALCPLLTLCDNLTIVEMDSTTGCFLDKVNPIKFTYHISGDIIPKETLQAISSMSRLNKLVIYGQNYTASEELGACLAKLPFLEILHLCTKSISNDCINRLEWHPIGQLTLGIPDDMKRLGEIACSFKLRSLQLIGAGEVDVSPLIYQLKHLDNPIDLTLNNMSLKSTDCILDMIRENYPIERLSLFTTNTRFEGLAEAFRSNTSIESFAIMLEYRTDGLEELLEALTEMNAILLTGLILTERIVDILSRCVGEIYLGTARNEWSERVKDMPNVTLL